MNFANSLQILLLLEIMNHLEQYNSIIEETKKKYPAITDTITLLYLSGKSLLEIWYIFKTNLYSYIFTNLSNYIQWAEKQNIIYEKRNIIALSKLISLIDEESNLPGYGIEKILIKIPTLLVAVCLLEVLSQKYGKHMGLVYASLTAITQRQESLVYIYIHIALNSGNFENILKDISSNEHIVLCKYYFFCVEKAEKTEKLDFTEKERYLFRNYAKMSSDEIMDYLNKIQYDAVNIKRHPDFNYINPGTIVEYLKIDLLEDRYLPDKEDILTKIHKNLDKFNSFTQSLASSSTLETDTNSLLKNHFLIEHKRFANITIHFILLKKTNKEDFSKMGINFNLYVDTVNKQFATAQYMEKLFKNFYELFDLSIHTLQNELFSDCLQLQENICCYIISLINNLADDVIDPDYFIYMENKINEYPYNPLFEKIVGFFEIFNPNKNNSILINKYKDSF